MQLEPQMNTPCRSLPRRDFLQAGAASLAIVPLGPSSLASMLQAAAPSAARRSIGIQVGAVSFVDEGAGNVLDILSSPRNTSSIEQKTLMPRFFAAGSTVATMSRSP